MLGQERLRRYIRWPAITQTWKKTTSQLILGTCVAIKNFLPSHTVGQRVLLKALRVISLTKYFLLPDFYTSNIIFLFFCSYSIFFYITFSWLTNRDFFSFFRWNFTISSYFEPCTSQYSDAIQGIRTARCRFSYFSGIFLWWQKNGSNTTRNESRFFSFLIFASLDAWNLPKSQNTTWNRCSCWRTTVFDSFSRCSRFLIATKWKK